LLEQQTCNPLAVSLNAAPPNLSSLLESKNPPSAGFLWPAIHGNQTSGRPYATLKPFQAVFINGLPAAAGRSAHQSSKTINAIHTQYFTNNT
jgi:hypothetical protein